jgi:hypothetical protein
MKRKLITGLVVALLVFGVQISFVANSFPGFHSNGDCNTCHNYPATAYNSSLANDNVKIDGIPDDSMWANTYGRRAMIPVASTFGSAHVFITMYFGQNATHFFMMASWEDSGINGADEPYSDTDGIAVMFNINTTDFDTGYGMDRAPDNTAVDLVRWTPHASATGTGVIDNAPHTVSSYATDEYIYDNGRHDDASNEWTVGAVYGNVTEHEESNYNVEFARPLTTNDPNDVQFDVSKYYEFGIVIFNNTSGSKHWISPAYDVFVYSANGDNSNIATVTGYLTDHITETETVINTEVNTTTVTQAPISYVVVLFSLFVVPAIISRKRK